MLKPAAARGKRLPETMVAKIRRVSRSATTASARLEYTANNGVTKIYTDHFPLSEELCRRYTKVQEAVAPLDKERFMAKWCFAGQAECFSGTQEGGRPDSSAPCAAHPLREILPSFQLKNNTTSAPAVVQTNSGVVDAQRAAVASVLACSIRPFQLSDVFGASCGNLNFETTCAAVHAEVRRRSHCDRHLESLFHGSSPPEDAPRKLGRCTLHTWQAAVLARIMQLTERPERYLAEFKCPAPPHTVSVQCLVQQNAAVLHAGTGMGKTFVAAALSLDKLTYCIVLPNSTRQWATQATLTGAQAVWAEGSYAFRQAVDARTAEGASRGGLIIFSHTLLRSHYMQEIDLPTPDLIIIDEVHKAHSGFPAAVFRFRHRFPTAFALGLTATLESGDAEKDVASLLGIDSRAMRAAIIRIPTCANAAIYPTAHFEFRKVRMSRIERSAYTVALEIGRSDAVIRALLFPSTGSEGVEYKNRVWRHIMQTLSEANKRVELELVHILSRAVHQRGYRVEIEARLGSDATLRIYQLVGGRELPESYDSAPQTERRLTTVWASRDRLLGAYAFAAGVLSSLGNSEAAVDCPVCFDNSTEYFIAPCGHFVCQECLPHVRDCPLCRARGPVWRSGRVLRQELSTQQEPAPPEEEEEEKRQTSAKFYDIARLIDGLGESERVLVVSPLKSMLNEARAEIAKLGVSLAILRGGTLEQQATLRAWQGGSYKGLLSDPDLPALNLSEASVVVFLSPLLTDTQFAQATGRVVRQGSFHENVRVIVMAADGTQESEDLAKIERFREIACEHSQASSSSSHV